MLPEPYNLKTLAQLEAHFYEEYEWNEAFIFEDNYNFNYTANIDTYPAYLFLDERKGFKPTKSYLKKKLLCEQAIKEIKCVNSSINLTETQILVYRNKFASLNRLLNKDWNFSAFHDFRCIYFYLIWLYEIIELYPRVSTALDNFTSYDQSSIEDWLDDYNRLYFCHTHGTLFEDYLVDKDYHLFKMRNENFYFQSKKFATLCEFNVLFEKYYGF